MSENNNTKKVIKTYFVTNTFITSFPSDFINAKGEIFPCEAFKYLSGARPSIYERDIIDVWDNDELLCQLRTTNVDCVSVCNHCEYRRLWKIHNYNSPKGNGWCWV